MKGMARKIKDNEWIAEVTEHYGGNMFEQGQQTERYPVVSTSDKEWLEKNNMDGKEVEGDVTHPTFANGRLKELKQVFALTTPPIHSDPAGEKDKSEWSNADLHKKLQTALDRNIQLAIENERLKLKPSTPQTGITYTEREVEQIAKDYVFNICDIVDGEEIAVYKYKREGDLGVRAAVDVWKIMNNIPLTKQNPKQ